MAQGFFSLIAIMKRTSADQVHMTGQSGTKARVSDAGFMSMHVDDGIACGGTPRCPHSRTR